MIIIFVLYNKNRFSSVKNEAKRNQLLPDCNESVSHKDEIFYKVMVPDKYEHSRVYGDGPSPTDVHGTKRLKVNEKEYERLRSEIRSEFQDKFDHLEAQFELIRTHMMTCPSVVSKQVNKYTLLSFVLNYRVYI